MSLLNSNKAALSKYKWKILLYKLGIIKNKNMNVTNLEIGYYQNEKVGSMIYIYNIWFLFGYKYTSSYKIGEEIDDKWYL